MSLNENVAKLFGVVLTLTGVLGFVMASPLFGLFQVTTGHSIVHLLTGLVFAWAGFSATEKAQSVNLWLGVVYLLLGVVGVASPATLAAFEVNMADTYLHLALGLVAGGVGWKAD